MVGLRGNAAIERLPRYATFGLPQDRGDPDFPFKTLWGSAGFETTPPSPPVIWVGGGLKQGCLSGWREDYPAE